jgi:AcrR family transcriptional regulator
MSASVPSSRIGAGAREELLQAAGRAIGRVGIDAVRLLDVAREAGMSIGALQHHFETRDAMVLEAVEAVARATVETALDAERAGGDAWSSLVGVVRSLNLTAEPRLDAATWIELCAVASRDAKYLPAVRSVQDVWREIVERIVDRGIAEGAFAPVLPRADAVAAIVALCDGVMVAAAAAPEGMDVGEVERRVLPATAALLGRPVAQAVDPPR